MIRYSDNRNFFRMMVNTEMEVEITEPDSSRSLPAVCRDLSATGMAIETDEPIDMGTEVLCKLEGGSNNLAALNAKAKVIRCHQVDNGNYILGVEILEHV